MKKSNIKNQHAVILESSFLRTDPFLRKESGVWIKILSEKGFLEIHLPYIVKNEIKSQILNKFKENILDVFEVLKKRIEHSDKSVETHQQISDFESLIQNSYRLKNEELDNWYSSSLFVNETDFGLSTKNVFEKYFNGDKPFRNLKAREDIPDAFVFNYILNQIASYKMVSVICNDKRISEALPVSDNLFIYDSLDTLIINNIDVSTKITQIRSKEDFNEIEEFLENYLKNELFETGSFYLYDRTDQLLEDWIFESELLHSIDGQASIIENQGWNLKDDTFKFTYNPEDSSIAEWTISAYLELEYIVSEDYFQSNLKPLGVESFKLSGEKVRIRESVEAQIEIFCDLYVHSDRSKYKTVKDYLKYLSEEDAIEFDISGTGFIQIIKFNDRKT